MPAWPGQLKWEEAVTSWPAKNIEKRKRSKRYQMVLLNDETLKFSLPCPPQYLVLVVGWCIRLSWPVWCAAIPGEGRGEGGAGYSTNPDVPSGSCDRPFEICATSILQKLDFHAIDWARKIVWQNRFGTFQCCILFIPCLNSISEVEDICSSRIMWAAVKGRISCCDWSVV